MSRANRKAHTGKDHRDDLNFRFKSIPSGRGRGNGHDAAAGRDGSEITDSAMNRMDREINDALGQPVERDHPTDSTDDDDTMFVETSREERARNRRRREPSLPGMGSS